MLESKKGVVMLYDYDLKKDVGTKKMIYSDLINAEIGIVFDVKEQPKNKLVNGSWVPSGETKLVAELKLFADSDTKHTAAEYLDNSKPVAVDRYVNLLLEDKHIEKQANNQPTAPVKDAINLDGDYDDDIPF
jgi:hypothetical protein